MTGKGQYEDALFIQDLSNAWKPIIKENIYYEIGKNKIVWKTRQCYLPFHIRIIYHGKRTKDGYNLLDLTFFKYSRRVLRKWAIDLVVLNRYFEINKER
jgi:hypothetical protein